MKMVRKNHLHLLVKKVQCFLNYKKEYVRIFSYTQGRFCDYKK